MHAVIFGASGGIGSALIEVLSAREGVSHIHAVSRSAVPESDKVTSYTADFLNEADLARVSGEIKAAGSPELVIVATGILSDGDVQPEKTYRHQSLRSFERIFQINTFGPALVAKHVLPIMPRKGRTVFAALSARVGSVSDNRGGGWHAYRASKAALNMLIKNYAIEQKFRNKDAVIVGLHPGTVDTDLSKPFQSNLPDGQVITPERSAKALLGVIDGLASDDSGKLFGWKGEEIAP